MFQESASPRLPASFNRLAWSNLAAQSAEQVGLAAAPIVAVLALGAGAGTSGWLQTAQTLPFMLLAIPAGVLALAVTGGLTVSWLALLGFVGACGTVAYSVTAPALVPALVPPAMLV